jgi:hypothetical protein
LAFDFDVSAVRGDDVVNDRQPQPGSR